jgi:predicted nucleic acid-binding protein
MILVDTSVWVDHLRRGDAALVAILHANRAASHDFVIGELACGHLKARGEILALLASLPRVAAATEAETLYFLDQRGLFGRGLGYIDVHLLVASVLHGDVQLWTRDRKLGAVAVELGVAHPAASHSS